MRIQDTSNLVLVMVITNRNIPIEIPPTISLSENMRIGFSNFPSKVISYSRLTSISFVILLLMVPLSDFVGLGRPPIINMMQWYFPFQSCSTSQLLSLFPLGPLTPSKVF